MQDAMHREMTMLDPQPKADDYDRIKGPLVHDNKDDNYIV